MTTVPTPRDEFVVATIHNSLSASRRYYLFIVKKGEGGPHHFLFHFFFLNQQ
jgi:hypothetical protein